MELALTAASEFLSTKLTKRGSALNRVEMGLAPPMSAMTGIHKTETDAVAPAALNQTSGVREETRALLTSAKPSKYSQSEV